MCYPGATYHVIVRGNARRWIFEDDHDRLGFFELLAGVLERYGWLLYAYCLMSNHYHLVVETPLANLSLGMRQLNGRYARRFNLRRQLEGHVFQARFRSILVENEPYLLELCRYVVLNPVRAALCEHPADWAWSSYNATVNGAEAPVPLTLDRLLASFAPTRRSAQRACEAFVLEGLEDALADRVRGERLGGKKFLRDDFGYDEPIAEVPRVQWLPDPPSLEELFAIERLPLATAYRRYGYTLREIGAYLGCHYATVSRALRREEEQLCRNARPDTTEAKGAVSGAFRSSGGRI
ncbi:MAG: transposase [Gaiellaceae bacterium]